MAFESHVERLGIPMYKLVGETLNHLIEKYDPKDSEKLKQWAPIPLDLNKQHLRSAYLTKDQITTLRDFADKASTALGQNVQRGTVIRSAIMEYLKSK